MVQATDLNEMAYVIFLTKIYLIIVVFQYTMMATVQRIVVKAPTEATVMAPMAHGFL